MTNEERKELAKHKAKVIYQLRKNIAKYENEISLAKKYMAELFQEAVNMAMSCEVMTQLMKLEKEND